MTTLHLNPDQISAKSGGQTIALNDQTKKVIGEKIQQWIQSNSQFINNTFSGSNSLPREFSLIAKNDGSMYVKTPDNGMSSVAGRIDQAIFSHVQQAIPSSVTPSAPTAQATSGYAPAMHMPYAAPYYTPAPQAPVEIQAPITTSQERVARDHDDMPDIFRRYETMVTRQEEALERLAQQNHLLTVQTLNHNNQIIEMNIKALEKELAAIDKELQTYTAYAPSGSYFAATWLRARAVVLPANTSFHKNHYQELVTKRRQLDEQRASLKKKKAENEDSIRLPRDVRMAHARIKALEQALAHSQYEYQQLAQKVAQMPPTHENPPSSRPLGGKQTGGAPRSTAAPSIPAYFSPPDLDAVVIPMQQHYE